MHPKRQAFNSKFYSIFVSSIILVLLLSSCGLLGSKSNPATAIPASPTILALLDTPTLLPPSPTPQVPMETPTSIPPSPTPQMPMETPTNGLPDPALQLVTSIAPVTGSIVFTPGTTAAVVQGSIQPGQIVTYTLGAMQSQLMILIMDAANNDVTLGVFAPDGSKLVDPANKWWNWQGALPKTGLYTIQVNGGATTKNFVLTIKIPQTVHFASGTSSITLNSTTVNGYPFDYALNCGAGQTMTASLNVPSSTAYLDIFGGTSGDMLLNDWVKANTWTGILPQTQDYVVEVVPNNFQVVNYGLTVSCTGAVLSALTQPGDIVIAPGSTAAVKHGTVGPGQVVTYTVQAEQYQPLIVNVGTVGTANNNVTLGVLDPDGAWMFNPALKYLNWQVPLHKTGLYTIQVIGGSTTENYELTIKLPRLVQFAAGTNSITIKSATEQGYIVSYAINRSLGETLTAALDVDSSIAYLDIFGVRTGSILSYTEKASTWTGVLPETQMYVIEVIPRGGWVVGYSLTISTH